MNDGERPRNLYVVLIRDESGSYGRLFDRFLSADYEFLQFNAVVRASEAVLCGGGVWRVPTYCALLEMKRRHLDVGEQPIRGAILLRDSDEPFRLGRLERPMITRFSDDQ